MNTSIQKVNVKHPQKGIILQAANLLQQNNVAAFPTETVYGLGARLSDIKAIKKIFTAKHRPADNPLIVHVSSASQAASIANVTPQAELLIDAFWPGPLTLVLKKKSTVPDIATAGLQTVCVRMPSHPVALALIEAVGEPIVAPSANTSGAPSPTTAQHVYDDLQDAIPLILDGGACTIGLESTVLDLTSTPPCILRPGAVTFEQLEKIIPGIIPYHRITLSSSAISPGMQYRHYAPKAPLILIENPTAPIPPEYQDKKIAILNLREEKNLASAAQQLFANLRAFDQQGVDAIIVYGVKESGIGVAIMNRLRKAATRIIT